MALTQRQSRFVAEYLIDLNGTQAAIRAGYSAKTANEQASRLLANVNIQAAIQEAMKARQERTELTAQSVIDDIQAIKLDAMKEIADNNGNMRMSDRTAALKATELIGKHIGMFRERVELTGRNGGQVQVSNIDVSNISTAALAELMAAKDAADKR